MDLTLDEFLIEIDRWKQPVSDRTAALRPPDRAREDQEARAWLEGMLGRQLRAVPAREVDASRIGREASS